MMPDPITFNEQANAWLDSLAVRRRKPIAPASLAAFRSYIRKLLPLVGLDTRLEDIGNGFVKDIVTKLVAEDLSAKTIQELVATIKQVVKSAVDGDGNPLFPRTWNNSFIDLPTIDKQRQPCITVAELERIIKDAPSDQERMLYALLAGSGLRISECLAVRVAGTNEQTSWNKHEATISVRASIFRGREIGRTKTAAARREVDLDPRLNTLLDQFVAASNIQTGDYLFQARGGRAMHLRTATQRLAKHKIGKCFHSFRRYRITRLRELGFPEDLLRFAVGHEGKSITDRYSKLSECIELRKEWTERAGVGFELPKLSKPGDSRPLNSVTRRPTKPAIPFKTAVPVEEIVPFQATDDDLPAELFEPLGELAGLP